MVLAEAMQLFERRTQLLVEDQAAHRVDRHVQYVFTSSRSSASMTL
jgi:hypothetical protein